MKYLVLRYVDERAWARLDPAEQAGQREATAALVRDLVAAGKASEQTPLQPAWAATSIRARNGSPVITDGPFAGTREQLAGCVLIEAKDLHEAVEIGTQFALVNGVATIEVRPVLE